MPNGDKIGPVQQEQFLRNVETKLRLQYRDFITGTRYLPPIVSDNFPARLKLFTQPKTVKSFFQTLSARVLEFGILVENRATHIMIDIDEDTYFAKRNMIKNGKSTKVDGSNIGIKSFHLLLIGHGFHQADIQEESDSTVLVILPAEHKYIQLMYVLDVYKQHGVAYVHIETSLRVSLNPETNYQIIAPETIKPIHRLCISDFNKLSHKGKVRFLTDYLDQDVLCEVLKTVSIEKNSVFQDASQDVLKAKIETLGLALVKKDDPVVLQGTSLTAKQVSLDEIFITT